MSRFLLFTLTLLISGCYQEKQLDLDLSDEALVAIIQDVHVANAIVVKYRSNERDSVSQILRLQIAEIHDISVEEIDFYMEQIQLYPVKYLELEKIAVTNLKAMKDSLKLNPGMKALK